jgi:ABC-type transport system substrate-binding protein
MRAHDRTAARARRRRARRAIGALATAAMLVAALLCGCGTQQTQSPATSASPAAATSAPTAIPATAYADTLRVSWDPLTSPFFEARFASGPGGMVNMATLVYSALYRLDAHFSPAPDLADGPCVPEGDGTVIRCRLIATTFHDGTPLTADDVAYTYRIWLSPTHPMADYGLTGSLREVRVVDGRTVDFLLSSVDPSFLTSVLPQIPIFSRHGAEAAYTDFVAGTKELTATGLTKLADAIDEELGRDPPVCSPRVDAVAAILERIGIAFYREDYPDRTGSFDACAYVENASYFIRAAVTALESAGLDAVAAISWYSINEHPVGTGPYRFVSGSAGRIHLEAWPGYHGGLAATRYVDLVPTKGDGSDLEAGSLDILQYAELNAAHRATAGAGDVRVATSGTATYFALFFNVRSGRLFADVSLRRALQLCVDLPRDVDAATAGAGMPVYGPVMPGSWANDPALPKPARDTAAARTLIEGDGWQRGADGIYERDGVRLAAGIVVRAEAPDRDKMADLVALQARDCGMDLDTVVVTFADIGAMLATYPHDVPHTGEPFDLYLGGWSNDPDPASGMNDFLSSNVSDAAHPDAVNFGGFADATLDGLTEAARATYDQAERARLYRLAQEELAAQLPALFLWSPNGFDMLRTAVATVDGPLDLTAPNWGWQPERLVILTPSP